MTPLEKDIEQKLIKIVKRHGGRCPKWVSPGWSGVPDRLCLLPGGQIIFVETKRPKGAQVAALQKKWREWLQELGFTVLHVYNEADLEALERSILGEFETERQAFLAQMIRIGEERGGYISEKEREMLADLRRLGEV